MAPKFLAYIVILCFERRCPKQNSVIRLKSKNFAPHPQILGCLRLWMTFRSSLSLHLFCVHQSYAGVLRRSSVETKLIDLG